MTSPARQTPIESVAQAFYRSWDGNELVSPGESDRLRARELVERYGQEMAEALVPLLVRIVKQKWPACKSFSGAVSKYLPDALAVYRQQEQRQQHSARDRARQQQLRDEQARQQTERAQLAACWETLPLGERQQIEELIRQRHPEHRDHPNIIQGLCLLELGRRQREPSLFGAESHSAIGG